MTLVPGFQAVSTWPATYFDEASKVRVVTVKVIRYESPARRLWFRFMEDIPASEFINPKLSIIGSKSIRVFKFSDSTKSLSLETPWPYPKNLDALVRAFGLESSCAEEEPEGDYQDALMSLKEILLRSR